MLQILTEGNTCTCVCLCVCVFDQRGQFPNTGKSKKKKKKNPVTIWFSTEVKRIDSPHSTIQGPIFAPSLKHFSCVRREASFLDAETLNPPIRFCWRDFIVIFSMQHREVTARMGFSLLLSPHFGTHKTPVKHYPTHVASRIRKTKYVTTLLWKTLTRKGKGMPTEKCMVISFLLPSNSQLYPWGSWPISIS